MFVHIIPLVLLLYIWGATVFWRSDMAVVLSAVLTISFLLHWWFGIRIFFILPNNLSVKVRYICYFFIAILLLLGILCFFNPIIFFVTYGFAFILVIPLYTLLNKQKEEDVGIENKKYFQQKLFLEYFAGVDFF